MIISDGLQWLKTSPSQCVCRAQKWHWDLWKRRSQTWRYWVSVATSAQTKNLQLSTGGYFLLCMCACVWRVSACVHKFCNMCHMTKPSQFPCPPVSPPESISLFSTVFCISFLHLVSPHSCTRHCTLNFGRFLHWQIRIYWNVLCDIDKRFYPFLTKYKWWNNNRICVITVVVW